MDQPALVCPDLFDPPRDFGPLIQYNCVALSCALPDGYTLVQALRADERANRVAYYKENHFGAKPPEPYPGVADAIVLDGPKGRYSVVKTPPQSLVRTVSYWVDTLTRQRFATRDDPDLCAALDLVSAYFRIPCERFTPHRDRAPKWEALYRQYAP
jgi:hypothetical protein